MPNLIYPSTPNNSHSSTHIHIQVPHSQSKEERVLATMATFFDDDNSFQDFGSLSCDDLLDVDQQDIKLVTPTVHSRPCVSICVSECDSLSACMASNAGLTSTSLCPSREKLLAQKIDMASKMEHARRKLLHSMERTISSRAVMKRRRLSPALYISGGNHQAEQIRQSVYDAMQDRIHLMRRSLP